jgi:hypothetical protein
VCARACVRACVQFAQSNRENMAMHKCVCKCVCVYVFACALRIKCRDIGYIAVIDAHFWHIFQVSALIFGFLNFARALVPARIALTLATAPLGICQFLCCHTLRFAMDSLLTMVAWPCICIYLIMWHVYTEMDESVTECVWVRAHVRTCIDKWRCICAHDMAKLFCL